jgi:translation initiation factor 2 beta subunit (eIF-2beta)/eIF-5
MKEKYLVDVFYRKIYGPYTNKRIMDRDQKLIKEVSDLCLEVASNVLIQEKKDLVNFKNFEHSTIEDVEKTYILVMNNCEEVAI